MNIDVDKWIETLANLLASKLSGKLPGSGGNKRLLTVDEAAEYVGRTPKAMWHIVNSGQVKTVRLDRRVYLDIKDLDQWIDSSKV